MGHDTKKQYMSRKIGLRVAIVDENGVLMKNADPKIGFLVQ